MPGPSLEHGGASLPADPWLSAPVRISIAVGLTLVQVGILIMARRRGQRRDGDE
ncbi:MAG: hypothetical protein ACOY93_11200 [Bacillota bacterium]